MKGALLVIAAGLGYLAWRKSQEVAPTTTPIPAAFPQPSGPGYATKEDALANLPLDASKNVTVVQDATDGLWYIVSFGGFEYMAHQLAAEVLR